MNRRWIYLLLVSIVGIPPLIYLVGGLLAGPYEGDYGVFGLMFRIYGDALTGSPAALVVLLSPLLLIAIWMGCARLGKLIER